jgi:hypothetical protein
VKITRINKDDEVKQIVKDAGYDPKEVRVYTSTTIIMIPEE